ncbi:cation channel sperm-associated auxiliary subunit TMEM249 [Candoia aspera]|uniref:cation channel sperm-associated auxiliary subunit TMEM249 n=1 Tax=Candoia aspera TaxID=51853 RepID=UPI002FD8637F
MITKSILRGPLTLWYCSFINSEQYLDEQLQENKYFPFQLQQPKVFVIEYYKDMIWKALLCLVVSLIASIFYFKKAGSHQDISAFFIFSMVTGLWLLVSNMSKRRLIINHARNFYQFYIKGILWQEGPLHQIYVRLVGQRDAYGKLFYSLIINGYRLEVLTLVHLTSNYELINTLGHRIARHLNLNYFDYEDISMRHVIRHLPPEEEYEEEDEDTMSV